MISPIAMVLPGSNCRLIPAASVSVINAVITADLRVSVKDYSIGARQSSKSRTAWRFKIQTRLQGFCEFRRSHRASIKRAQCLQAFNRGEFRVNNSRGSMREAPLPLC
jgi:hypothetical protein